ncbi:serine/threonine protein kinase [Nitzschia inconspicua]|uniref:non-specific serine/threonine protein kinase n=1 Tax=Nitzschia inconspicua TaxID=303405 RepID=A0A9K3PDF4_9STRA|nr:serine/threonine protein kinase [Nitzschia inconspicua]KAG7371682.1 serine/threonine protein kinase [Nitzschia inconspicua]
MTSSSEQPNANTDVNVNVNLKRLRRILSETPPSSSSIKEDGSSSHTGGSGSFQIASKPLLSSNDARNMVEWASQRLRYSGSGLEDLYGVTLAKTTLPVIPKMSHSQYKLTHMLGHGHFHCVYQVQDSTNGTTVNVTTPTGQQQQYLNNNNNSNNKAFHHHRPDKIVIKTLRPKLKLSASELSTGVADLIKEGLLLQALQLHPNIIDLKGWSHQGLAGFLTGQHDGFFLVLQELSTTLKDKMGTGGDWRDEDLFLQDRLGRDYAYGYYYHHTTPTTSPPAGKSSSEGDPTEPSKKKGFLSRLFSGSPSSHRNGEHGLSYRSPQAQKALVDKQHSFFMTRLQRCIELADALAYMHDKRILHRDLKPANIGFVHRRTIQTLKVFDMDMSRVIPRQQNGDDGQPEDDPNVDVYPHLTQQVGSRRYICPEISRSEPYNLKSDVYSIGLIVWEMLSLHPKAYAEFEAISDTVERGGNAANHGIFFDGDASLDRAILVEGRLRPTLPRAQWSKELADLVAACWHHDMHHRPTMKEAKMTLTKLYDDLKSNNNVGMVPSTNKNEVCSMTSEFHPTTAISAAAGVSNPDSHGTTNKESPHGLSEDNTTMQTAPTIPSSINDDVVSTTSSLSHMTSITETPPLVSAAAAAAAETTTTTTNSHRVTVKKSQSWCSLVSLGMVDGHEETSSDEESTGQAQAT